MSVYVFERERERKIPGTMEVTLKPIFTTIPEILFAAYNASTACLFLKSVSIVRKRHPPMPILSLKAIFLMQALNNLKTFFVIPLKIRFCMFYGGSFYTACVD
jgi:hypothetical protein